MHSQVEKTQDGKEALRMILSSGKADLKIRMFSAIGVNKKEIKFAVNNSIKEMYISCDYSGGVTKIGNYLLACFDCSAVVATSLIGADGDVVPVESLSADIAAFQIKPDEVLKVSFSEPLDYAGNAGFLGNVFLKSVNATATLDGAIYGVNKT